MKFHFVWILFVLVSVFIIYLWTMAEQRRDLFFHYNLADNPESSARSEIQVREIKDQKFLKKVYLLAIIIVVWQGIWSPTNKLNIEKELAKSQKTSYISAYQMGWNDQCQALFFRLGGVENYAYGKSITLTYPQCMSLENNSSALDAFDNHIGGYIRDSSENEMKENGRNQANRDLLDQIFSMSPYWCYGADCLAGSDFGIYRP